jgi:hypothetical protein
MHPFETAWMRFHPGRYPLSHKLRESDTPHWARFHALPQSQRYAADGPEMQTLLARFNALADEVLGIGEPCWLSHCSLASADLGPLEGDERMQRVFGLSEAFRATWDIEPGEPGEWAVLAAKTTWRSGAFDTLFRAIAKQEAIFFLWMSDVTGALVAPYDSGVDLFLPSAEMVADLKRRRIDWLPANAEGL